MLGVVFHALGENHLVVGQQHLVIVLAHDVLLADQVLHVHAFERERDLKRIGRLRLVDRRGKHLEHRQERHFREVEIMSGAEALIELLRLGIVIVDRDVLLILGDRGQPVLPARADRRRPADQVREVGVVPDVQAGVVARLDEQVQVTVVVAGDQALRARRLDLGDIGREVLHLPERHQFVADDLDIGAELLQEAQRVVLDRLAEDVVLVQQIHLLDRLRQRLDAGVGALLHAAGETELPEVAFLVGQLGRQRAAVHVDDAIVRVAGVVLRHAVDQRGADIRSGALHHERDVLVGHALQRDQRLGRLQLVVEGHQLELPAQRAALRVHVVDDVVEHLKELIAAGGERP